MANYLISAKKNVDSLLYIVSNRNKLSSELYTDRIRKIKKEFCISSCIVIDSLPPHSKKEFKEYCPAINILYYERNKNSAHRDSNYTPKIPRDLDSLLTYMRFTLLCIRYKCQKVLPNIVRLDFMPHDRELFRILENVNPEQEKSIHEKKANFFSPIKRKYTSEKKFTDQLVNIVENLEDIDYLSKGHEDINVKFTDGINLYEGMQNRQDSLITLNVSFDTNAWISFNSELLTKYQQLVNLKIIDSFGLPKPPEKLNQQQMNAFFKILFL